MPQIIPLLIAAALYVGAYYVAVALMFVSIAYGNSQAAKAKRQARDAYNASLQDRTIVVRSTQSPKILLFGEAVVGATMYYMGSFGPKLEFLYIGFLLGPGHGILAIDDVSLNDQWVGALDGNGDPTGGSFTRAGDTYKSQTFTSANSPAQVVTLAFTPLFTAGNWQVWPIFDDGGRESGGARALPLVSVSGNNVTIDTTLAPFGETVVITYISVPFVIPYARIEKHLGLSTETASALLIAGTGGEVQASDRGDNLPSVAMRLTFDENMFAAGIPTPKFKTRGARIYDPRKDSTNGGSGSHRFTDPSTWEYSKNAPLIARFYIVSPLGGGASNAEIDDALVIAAANIADEDVIITSAGTVTVTNNNALVTGVGTAWNQSLHARKTFIGPNAVRYTVASVTSPTALLLTTTYGGSTLSGQAYTISEKRYEINGTLSSDVEFGGNLEMIAQSMGGVVTFAQGKWRIYAGAYRTPTITLNDSDFLAATEVGVQAKPEQGDLFNAVKGQFVDPLQNYQITDYPAIMSTTYEAQDGGERIFADLPFPLTDSATMAQRLALLALEQARQSLTVQATFSMRAYRLWPGETVMLNSTNHGWVNKVFRIVEREFSLRAFGPKLTLREEAPGVYTATAPSTYDLSPNTTMPNPFSVSSPTGLTLTSGTAELLRNVDGSIVTRIRVAWTAHPNAGVLNGGRIEVQWSVSAPLKVAEWVALHPAPGDATVTYIAPVDDGAGYQVRIRALNGLGVASTWTYSGWHIVIGKTAAPSNVTAATASVESFGIRIKATEVPDADVFEYIARQGGTNWESASPLDGTSDTVFGPEGYLWRPQTAGAKTIRIKARDTTGNQSATAFSLAFTVDAPAAPGLTASFNGRDVRLAWSLVTGTFAIREYVAQFDSTGGGVWVEWDRVDAAYSERRANWLGSRTFRVFAVDAAGNAGATSSTTVNVAAPATPVVAVSVLTNRVIITAADPQTTLPIERIELRRGAVGVSWASAASLGVLGPSRLANFEETVGGSYDYLLRAMDSAGNESVEGRQSAVVSDPPGFRRFLNYDGDFSLGTRTNVLIEATTSRLLAPFNATESEATHYSARGWATDQAKIDAGYTFIAHPTNATGSYQEDLDFGSTVAGALITLTLTSVPLVGVVVVQPRISRRLLLTDPWIDGPLGTASLFATNFRYIRYRFEFTSQAQAALGQFGVLSCARFNGRLSTERKTDTGSNTVAAADTGGTLVTFARTDFDVSPNVMPSSGEAGLGYFAEVDHGATTRTTCRLYLFDAGGVRRSGRVNWIAEQGL